MNFDKYSNECIQFCLHYACSFVFEKKFNIPGICDASAAIETTSYMHELGKRFKID